MLTLYFTLFSLWFFKTQINRKLYIELYGYNFDCLLEENFLFVVTFLNWKELRSCLSFNNTGSGSKGEAVWHEALPWFLHGN